MRLAKPQIIARAQHFTNESFRQVRGEYYYAWAAMHDMVHGRPIARLKLSTHMCGDPGEFKITERGSHWG